MKYYIGVDVELPRHTGDNG